MFGKCWELMAKFHLLKIRTSIDIFSTEKCKVAFGLKYISPQLKTLNMIISIQCLFNFYTSKAQYFAPKVSFVSDVKSLRSPITSHSDFRQYIAEYTVAHFRRRPVRRRVTFASALELPIFVRLMASLTCE